MTAAGSGSRRNAPSLSSPQQVPSTCVGPHPEMRQAPPPPTSESHDLPGVRPGPQAPRGSRSAPPSPHTQPPQGLELRVSLKTPGGGQCAAWRWQAGGHRARGVALGCCERAFTRTRVHASWEVGVCASLGTKEGGATRGLSSSLEDGPSGPEVKKGLWGHLAYPGTSAQGKGKGEGCGIRSGW